MMSLTRNLALIFKQVPRALPVPGEDLVIENRPLDITTAPDSGFVLKNIYASLDPYMRMMLVAPDTKHYRKPFTIGEPLLSGGIAEIIRSSHEQYPVGSLLRARLPIQEYTVVTPEWLDSSGTRIEFLPSGSSQIPLSMWLGPLGMTGQTAYSSIFEIGKPLKGETIFVSAASGAVGSLVGQICKQQGLRVIGSAGSDEKVKSLSEDFGFDGAFNYKNEHPADALSRLCPDGIDIYYDNVGGQQLEAAIENMNKGGRIVVCGMVSQYNIPSDERYGIKNLFRFVGQGLTMRGFLVGDILPRWREKHKDDMSRWLATGTLHAAIDETVGIEKAAEGFVNMLVGKNTGKAMVRIHA